MKASEFQKLYQMEYEKAKKLKKIPIGQESFPNEKSLFFRLEPGNKTGADSIFIRNIGEVRYFEYTSEEDDDEFSERSGLHRLDGPAVITKKHIGWFVHGLRHRTDGPALISNLGEVSEEFWVKGRKKTKEEFLQHFEIKESKFGKLVNESK